MVVALWGPTPGLELRWDLLSVNRKTDNMELLLC
jgi:hypothetical protein